MYHALVSLATQSCEEVVGEEHGCCYKGIALQDRRAVVTQGLAMKGRVDTRPGHAFASLANPKDVSMLGRRLGGRVHWSQGSELFREVPHIQLISDIGLEGSRDPLSKHI